VPLAPIAIVEAAVRCGRDKHLTAILPSSVASTMISAVVNIVGHGQSTVPQSVLCMSL
jgi:hypothetical protein